MNSKHDPRMSPLFAKEWARLQTADREQVIEDLKSVSKLKPGESFQVDPDGNFVRLKPGDIVPEIPIKVSDPEKPISEEAVIL